MKHLCQRKVADIFAVFSKYFLLFVFSNNLYSQPCGWGGDLYFYADFQIPEGITLEGAKLGFSETTYSSNIWEIGAYGEFTELGEFELEADGEFIFNFGEIIGPTHIYLDLSLIAFMDDWFCGVVDYNFSTLFTLTLETAGSNGEVSSDTTYIGDFGDLVPGINIHSFTIEDAGTCSGIFDYNYYYVDQDNDGFGTGDSILLCEMDDWGYSLNNLDCDDSSAQITIIDQLCVIDTITGILGNDCGCTPIDLTNGLVLYYPFSYGNMVDSSGYNNNGDVAGVVSVPDNYNHCNGAAYFGGSGDFISMPISESLNSLDVNNQMTVSFDFKLDDWNNSNEAWICNAVGAGGYHGLFHVTLVNNIDKLWFTPEGNFIDFNFDPSLDLWYNITLTADENIQQYRFYLNGTLIESVGFNPNSITTQEQPILFNIGGFKGWIDNLRLYNRVLHPVEINQMNLNSYSVGYDLPVAQISLFGSNPFCLGEEVLLTCTGGNSYLWSDGSINDSLFINQAGVYEVTVSLDTYCNSSAMIVLYEHLDTDEDGVCDPDDNCPSLNGVQGNPCDDGNETTSNDVINASCICAGTPIGPVYDCPLISANFGNSCDDNNTCTINDVIISSCECIGEFEDTDGDGICNANDSCPNINGLQGDTCDDSDPCTINDAINTSCVCAGNLQDTDSDGLCDVNDSCPNIYGIQGSACDDGDLTTIGDTIDENCTCVGILTGINDKPINVPIIYKLAEGKYYIGDMAMIENIQIYDITGRTLRFTKEGDILYIPNCPLGIKFIRIVGDEFNYCIKID